MKTFVTVSLISIFCFLNTSCNTTFRRFKSANYAGNDDKLAKIRLFKAKLESPDKVDASKNLWLLSAQGQAELIGALSFRYKDNDKFLSSLNNKYLGKDDQNRIDYVSRSMQMIFSIEKLHDFKDFGAGTQKFTPADRIEQLDFSLKIDTETPLTFEKWNRYSTEYGTIDIGDISFSKSLSVSAGIGDTSSKIPFSISGSGSSTTTENQHLKYRYIQLTGNLDDKNLEIHEQGEREIDLAGNVVADVGLKFETYYQPIFKFDSLTGDNGDYNDPSKVKTQMLIGEVPDFGGLSDEVKVTLVMHYTYRHVKNNRGVKSFYEWDDRVEYYTGTDSAKVPLFKWKEIFPQFFYLGIKKNPDQKVSDIRHLKIKLPYESKPRALIFQNYDDAAGFLNWLLLFKAKDNDEKAKQIKIGNYEFWFGDDHDKPIALNKQIVEKIQDEIAPHRFYPDKKAPVVN